MPPTKERRIGNYRIIEKIATGGFGTTYKGEHILLREPVCIKHRAEVSPEIEQILIDEAKAMWDLRHFGIPSVRDFVRLDDGSIALVMSYIPGPTLLQIIEKNGPMDPEHVAWITQRILNTLMYMHIHGVVQGDLNPRNIIIQPVDHTVVIVDYGLSMIRPKKTDGAKGYTESFSSPEQLEGKVIIPESDLYSLGMTMIFALTGDLKPVERREIPKTTPYPLRSFIERLIELHPHDRPRVWKEENLCTAMERVREQAFGRTNSAMKPLSI